MWDPPSAMGTGVTGVDIALALGIGMGVVEDIWGLSMGVGMGVSRTGSTEELHSPIAIFSAAVGAWGGGWVGAAFSPRGLCLRSPRQMSFRDRIQLPAFSWSSDWKHRQSGEEAERSENPLAREDGEDGASESTSHVSSPSTASRHPCKSRAPLQAPHTSKNKLK